MFHSSDLQKLFLPDIQRQHIPDQIIENLECLICQCYLSCDPVYVSCEGKNICHRCIHSNGVPEGLIRNLAYERLASIMAFPCVYKNRGCPVRMSFGRELWRHEGDCSYGMIHQRLTSKQKQRFDKERGVIMTHSGHYYGTITPNVALWAPHDPEKNDNNDVIKKEYIDAVLKKNFKEEVVLGVSNKRRETPTITQGQVYQDDPRFSSASSYANNYVAQRSGDSGIYETSRQSLTAHPDNYSRSQSYQSEAGYASKLNYSASFNRQVSSASDIVRPKRGDSFKIGNQSIIDELKIKQKKKIRQKEGDGESLRSDDTLDSLEGSEALSDSQQHSLLM